MPEESFTEVSFYIVAHADDWQLFMYPNVYNDLIASNRKVVFIITTAGDAGLGETYWSAREEGAKSSLRFCLAPRNGLSHASGTREFNNHCINYWSINHVTCYFLRVPDGNLDGGGFSVTGFQSLARLQSGQIGTITAVDKATTYHSWSDVYTTIEIIILWESRSISNMRLNYLNPDTAANPNDHADHMATGLAVQATTIASTVQQALYVGYHVIHTAARLHPPDLFWKVGMFAAYEKAVFDGSGYSTLHEGVPTYLEWCMRYADFIIIPPCIPNAVMALT